jgi:iron(III) transport system substrate-binding protein
MIRVILILVALVTATPLSAQEATAQFGAATASHRITLRTTTDVAILAPTIEAFLAGRPDLGLDYEQWGSNDLYDLSQRDCAAGKPGADIVISSGVHQMVKLVNDNCAASWRSPATASLPPGLIWRDQIWGVSREPAVLVYNRDLVPAGEVPETRFDLLDLLRPNDSPYAGRVATYDIQASGLGFLFAFMDAQEASTFGALMEAFARSGAVATCCSAEIIAGVAKGDYLIAYNVLGSYARSTQAENPNLGIIEPQDYTLILSRAAILPGPSADPDAAALLDFLLSQRGQQVMARKHLYTAADTDETGGTQKRLITLGPALLVAMDRMTSASFLTRWEKAFSQ